MEQSAFSPVDVIEREASENTSIESMGIIKASRDACAESSPKDVFRGWRRNKEQTDRAIQETTGNSGGVITSVITQEPRAESVCEADYSGGANVPRKPNHQLILQ